MSAVFLRLLEDINNANTDESSSPDTPTLDGIFLMGCTGPLMQLNAYSATSANELSRLRNALATRPELAQTRLKNDNPPLHDFLYSTRGEDAAEGTRLLLQAHPAAAEEKDSQGRLPLHVAAEWCDSEECMRLLLQAYPAAAQERSSDGFFPLHLATRWERTSEGCIRLLLQANPAAAEEKCPEGWLPLHHLAGFWDHPSPALIWLLSAAFKQGLHVKGENGSTPPQLAETWRKVKNYAAPPYRVALLEQLAECTLYPCVLGWKRSARDGEG
jgi:ankyrin repeat protein